MKIIKIFFIVLIILIAGVYTFYQVFFRSAVPGYSGTIKLAGITAPVEVRTDDYGVPHLSAGNEYDLFFAQGYITARERIFQMDMTRLAGRGELSTLFGQATLDTDKYLKTLGFFRTAAAEYAAMPQKDREIINAYTEGVNAYLSTVKRLPREYAILGTRPEPWEPTDSVVVGTLMAYSLTRSVKADLVLYNIGQKVGPEVLELITPNYPDFAPTVSRGGDRVPRTEAVDIVAYLSTPASPSRAPYAFPLVPEIPASNWMIFSPSRSTTGNAIFTGSPDLEPKIPALFYLIHLSAPGYNVIGGSTPGAPGINVLGTNGAIAWSTVNGRVDELDYFIEEINPDNPNQYLTEEGYRDFEIIQETLKIKTKEGIKQEKLSVKISRHGPIISDVMPQAPPNTAMKWVGFEPAGIFTGFLALNRAQNFDEFRAALSIIRTPTLNIGYADANGNIGYQYIARVPIRMNGDGTLPVPGWDGNHEWVGFMPFEELPYDYNPDKGYLGSFNNLPKSTTYPMTNYYLFERATRFDEIMKGKETVGLDDARGFQTDTGSVVAKRWIPYITSACRTTDKLKRPLALFDGWDFSIDKKSGAAALFNAFYFSMMKNTVADEIGDDLFSQLSAPYLVYIIDLALTNNIGNLDFLLFDDVTTPDITEDRDDIIVKSMNEAVAELSDRLGDDPADWRWGDIHTMRFEHPMGKKLPFFNLAPIPTAGDDFTINAGLWDNANPFDMKSGGVIRMIVDFSNFENSTLVSPPGQSGLLKSPHYGDQAEIWAGGDQIPMHFKTAEDLENVLTLMPAP
ncbi:MAG: penicillin acylase family protein [Deltaproteobacteria bacterium]|nr:penicillin acylase family protein [Candidatus Zymogenaceae bacterium]